MGNTTNIFRKKTLIHKSLQLKYSIWAILIILVSLVIFAWDFYYTVNNITPDFFTTKIKTEIPVILISLTVKFILLSLIIGFLVIQLIHRIVGPMYRLQLDVRKMVEEADLTQTFRLREKDELKELAELLNQMVSGLRQRLITDDNFREKACLTLEGLVKLLNGNDQLSSEEKRHFINLSQDLIKESKKSPIQFKI